MNVPSAKALAAISKKKRFVLRKLKKSISRDWLNGNSKSSTTFKEKRISSGRSFWSSKRRTKLLARLVTEGESIGLIIAVWEVVTDARTKVLSKVRDGCIAGDYRNKKDYCREDKSIKYHRYVRFATVSSNMMKMSTVFNAVTSFIAPALSLLLKINLNVHFAGNSNRSSTLRSRNSLKIVAVVVRINLITSHC